MSIEKPNYTQVPNIILDNLDQYTPAETKILMFIARHTFGYHQARKRMSLSYMQNGTGLSRQGVANAITSLIEKGFVRRRKSAQSYEYSLNITGEPVNSVDQPAPAKQSTQLHELVNSVDQPAPAKQSTQLHELVNSVDTNKETSKETLDPKKTTTRNAPGKTSSTNGGSGGRRQLDPAFATVCQQYEADIGFLSQTVGAKLGEAVDEYGQEWVVEAIQLTALAGKSRLDYTLGILKNWRSNGRSKTNKHKPTPGELVTVEFYDPFGGATTQETMRL